MYPYSFFNLGPMGWAALTPGKTQYPLYRRASRPVWAGAEILAHTGIRFPDCPAYSAVAIPTALSRPIDWKQEKAKNSPVFIQCSVTT
jgi:hypothetical protein